MQIQPGGIADQTRKIKVGDELIQVNDHCIAGLSQQDVSDLLSQASLHVTLTLIRPFPDPIGPPQSQQGPPSVRSHPSPHPSPQVIEQQKYQSAPVDMLSGLPLVKAITIERDDNLGLGFTVSKTEMASGTTGIIVTNITPNGPAEKEGQLQIGDSVISIDGHKVLGDKYEKATHLLQQARCNGSVSLIVTANKSQLPSQLKERLEKSPKKRNMGDKRMRVRSEGVTLRNKVTKTQLSTRRRPVSVDCDINYDNLKELTDVSKINSQLLQQKNQAAVPSPNKVNTMTQAEMMKDVDLYTTSTTEQDVIVGKPTDIEIFCGNQPLGVVLAKEMNSYQSNMFIHKIQGKSPAALDGRLKPNDVILSICDQPLENLSRDQAYQLLLDAPPLVKMSIYRRPSDKGRKEEGHEIEVVELIKPEKGGLGLMIQGDQVDGGVIITEVIPDEVADRSGRVHPGDKILNINGENVSKYNQDSVSSILQTCRGLVSLTLHHSNQKYTNVSNISTLPGSSLNRSTPSREFTYSPSKIEVHPPPPVYDTSSPTKRIPRPFDPPPYLSPVDSAIKQSPRGTTPLRTDPSYNDDSTSPHPLKPHSNQFRDVVGQNIPDPKRYPPAGTTAIIPPPDRSDITYQSNIKHVILQRGPAGLGFSIAGGKGSPNGDLPICIRSISKDCVAARQGRIRQGDIILAVNGISFENITHKAAVDALTRSHGDITLTICST
jgi:multiple PDZ domain protein